MPVIGTSGSTSGDGKRRVAAWPKRPRPSSTLPKLPIGAAIDSVEFVKRALDRPAPETPHKKRPPLMRDRSRLRHREWGRADEVSADILERQSNVRFVG